MRSGTGNMPKRNRIDRMIRPGDQTEMTFISVQNTSDHAEIVPARDTFGVVLKPGEKATVCPEGSKGVDRFYGLIAAGKIVERGRRRSRVLQFIQHRNHDDDGFDRAA